MPESTWPTVLAWIGVLVGQAIILAVLSHRTRTVMHTETVAVLDRIDARAQARDRTDRLEGEAEAQS